MKKLSVLVFFVAAAMMLQAQSDESNEIRISAHKMKTFSEFATERVKAALDEWAKKGEFEKTADYYARVNETTYEQTKKELTRRCQEKYIEIYGGKLKHDVLLGSYDADNETYMLTDSHFGTLLVKVPVDDGPLFKANWTSAVLTPQYFIEADTLALGALVIDFPALEKRYEYSSKSSLNYETPNIAYNFGDIKIDADQTGGQRGKQTVTEKDIAVGKSKVDTDIPTTGVENRNTFAVIIANENYKRVAPVPFALNDGDVLARYCENTLGLPKENIKLYKDATKGDLEYAVESIERICRAYKGEASVIFYYTGHGIPDEQDKTSYLLPVDGYGQNVNSGYKLDLLYERLGAMDAKSVTVLLDACFSGSTRDGKMVAQAKGVAIKVREGVPQGNTVVFAAAQGDETAGFYKEEGHGMFTYFLLKKLQETRGEVTLSELSQYVIDEVGKRSAVLNKPQTPSVTPAYGVSDSWQTWKLK